VRSSHGIEPGEVTECLLVAAVADDEKEMVEVDGVEPADMVRAHHGR
jgi:hypothetical protein